MHSKQKYFSSVWFVFILFLSCTTSTNNPLPEVISKDLKIIKVRLIKEGTGHKPSDGVQTDNDSNIIIGSESNQYAAAVFDYYENDKKIIHDINWSTVTKNGEDIPANLHIHKHDDSYIVLVNLDYNEKKDVVLIVKLSKNNTVMNQKELIVKKRVTPIQKTIQVFDKNDNKLSLDSKIEINPNTTVNNPLTFKFVVEGRPNTINVSWKYTSIDDKELELPAGVSFSNSTPPLTGFFIFTIDPNAYIRTTNLDIIVVLKQDKLRLEKALTILPKTNS